jgi:hypothetical protein
MKDPLSKLLDNLEQAKDYGWVKTILVGIFDLTVYMLLLGILIITLPMLLPVIILQLLVTPALLLSTALESLVHSLSGMAKEKNSKKSTTKDTHTAWDSGTVQLPKGWD